MQVEAELIKRTEVHTRTQDTGVFASMLQDWKGLFAPKYADRVAIGIMMMFFQRKGTTASGLLLQLRTKAVPLHRMERHQRVAVLRPASDAEAWSRR